MLARSLLLAAVLSLAIGPAPALAECNDCNSGIAGGLGPRGCHPCPNCGHLCTPGPVDPQAVFLNSLKCSHCGYISEQEYHSLDCCRDCLFNWGDQYADFNALSPRFRPQWYVAADALFLVRDPNGELRFASLGPLGRTVLGTDNLQRNLEAGARLLVSRSLTDFLALEASFYGLNTWDETAAFRDTTVNALGAPGNLFSPFTEFGRVPLVGLDYNTLATISSTSDLHNAELNLRHRMGMLCGPIETTVMVGARYMQINEGFEYFSQSNLPTPLGSSNRINTGTENELIGMQLGGLAGYRISDRWWFDLDVKAALCQNTAQQATVYTAVDGNGGVNTFFGARKESNTAFVGELSLSSNYQLTQNLAFRAGYQAIWATGIAVAAENVPTNLAVITQGPPMLDNNGTIAYHGPHTGFILSW